MSRWWEDAECRNHDGGMWLDENGRTSEATAETARAKAICRTCPVRRECLDAANHEEATLGLGTHLIRGGLTSDERALMRRGEGRPTALTVEERARKVAGRASGRHAGNREAS